MRRRRAIEAVGTILLIAGDAPVFVASDSRSRSRPEAAGDVEGGKCNIAAATQNVHGGRLDEDRSPCAIKQERGRRKAASEKVSAAFRRPRSGDFDRGHAADRPAPSCSVGLEHDRPASPALRRSPDLSIAGRADEGHSRPASGAPGSVHAGPTAWPRASRPPHSPATRATVATTSRIAGNEEILRYYINKIN